MSTLFYTPSQQSSLWRILPDLIHSRQLLRDLVSKELRARYRNALIGFAWAVLQPLLMTLILTFVFSFVFAGRMREYGVGAEVSYPVFLLCGLIPWQFFSAAVSSATMSLIENQHLIKKVYFPREVIPISAVVNCLINFFIGCGVLLIVHLLFGGVIGMNVLIYPVILLIQLALVLGLALLLSCWNAVYRDVQYLVEIALLFGFYATPVFYPLSMIHDKYPWMVKIFLLNPMAGLITAYRQVLFDNRWPDLTVLLVPGIAAAALLICGAIVFRRRAPLLADSL